MIMFHYDKKKIAMTSVTLTFAHFSYILGQAIPMKYKHFTNKRSSWKLRIALINEFSNKMDIVVIKFNGQYQNIQIQLAYFYAHKNPRKSP